jgi:hypothetical protein
MLQGGRRTRFETGWQTAPVTTSKGGRANDDVELDQLDLRVLDDAVEFEAIDDPHDPSPTTLRRMSRGGQMIGSAMIGLAEVLQPKPKVEVPIEIATPGEPPNIDIDGLDEPFGEARRMVGPPMDQIKAKGRSGRSRKRRRA